uniref:CCHC-type domain-containing protein n=1 Tax=Biomphalaria glabrata TaxID=6526 RepID=A0A2C9M0W6_BIOGL
MVEERMVMIGIIEEEMMVMIGIIGEMMVMGRRNDGNDRKYSIINDGNDRETYGRKNDRSRERGNTGRESYDRTNRENENIGIESYDRTNGDNENNGIESYDRRSDRPKTGDRNRREVICFNCQEKGHMAYQCRKDKGNESGNRNAQGNSGTSDRGGNQGNRRQKKDNRP